ncbi:hypothetical protein HD806DRAFT_166050 [Xylariaceae sp. AK1471]|nr:hypothetical protein HD806DRAFT_166050 [Xylariaceae sp. AK1471]
MASTSSSSSASLPRGNRLSRNEAISYLTSDTFREVLEELPAGYERSKRLRIIAKALFDDSQISKSQNSLNYAIQFARDALKELPSAHEDIPGLADTLVFYAQTKAIYAKGAESTEEYILAIQNAIDAVQGGPSHGHFVQRLGWAYWARFENSSSNEDLETVITYIKAKVKYYVLSR